MSHRTEAVLLLLVVAGLLTAVLSIRAYRKSRRERRQMDAYRRRRA